MVTPMMGKSHQAGYERGSTKWKRIPNPPSASQRMSGVFAALYSSLSAATGSTLVALRAGR